MHSKVQSLSFSRIWIAGIIVFLLSSGQSSGTHLMGGSMTYEYTGSGGGLDNYHITLKIYRYCDASAGGTAALDPTMFLGIYEQDPLNPNADKNWFSTENLVLTSNQFINPPSVGPTCNFSTTVCVEEGIFEADISLAPSAGGYHLMVERCCRNGNIINLSTPGSVGQTYYCFIPPAPVINSSPQFSDVPVPYMCTNDTVSIVNNATDPDGDSLVYAFVTPYGGYSSSMNPIPDPQIDNNPYAFPIAPVLYNPSYSSATPFGAGGFTGINAQTGLTQYFIPNQGFYVVAIEIREYRNGVLIATIRRDLQLIAIACPPNTTPALSYANGSGTTSYTITEGQTICFPVTFTDPNGDSLYLTSSGTIFNAAIVNPPATLPNAAGDNIVTSQFCWSTDCGQARPNPYQFTVAVTDNGCPPKTTNITYSVKVNPATGPPVPSISILQNPAGPICTGTLVTFTALPTFGGTNPTFQWQLNGVNVGTNSSTWSSSTLSNGDVVTVSLVSNSSCVTTFNAVSPPVVIVVNPFMAPSVSVTAAPAGQVCAGTPITFTALPVNPGASPVYQWTVNGTNTGTNSTTFTSSTLTTGNQVGVSLTSNAACPAATSNSITVDIAPMVIPAVVITASTNSAICPGENITFTAYPTNGGTSPAYQWQVNGANAGTNSSTFSTTTLNNGDVVTVILTSSETCVTTPTATSAPIAVTVTPPSAPTVSISVSPVGPICANDNVIFTAVSTLGGATPFYQWQVNGINTGPNSPTWATSTLSDGDQVSVILTSSLLCAVPNTATSNIINMVVNPVLAASVTINQSPAGGLCPGAPVTFSATPINGGTTPSYQWQVNGINSGTNAPSFTISSLSTGDNIRVIMTSNGICVSPLSSMSNIITVSVLSNTTPSVSISQSPAFPVCQGTPVTFTATPSNAGFTPSFQWFMNGVPTGTNSTTLTLSSLSTNDAVWVQITSSGVCPAPPTSLSNTIIATVTPTAVPAVSITAAPSGPVCEGTPVTFNAAIVNGGTAPIIRWRVNGGFVLSGPTFTSSSLNNGDTIDVRLISNETCASPTDAYSNQIIMQVDPLLTPSASIALTTPGPLCAGNAVNFTSTQLNGGPNPTYQWLLNGVPFGPNLPSLNAVLNHQDSIQLVMTSSETCLTQPADTSNLVVLTINPNLTPAVTITAAPAGPYCPNDPVTFTATPVNGGASPSYQWTVNGNTSGSNSSTFTTTSLTNGSIVGVVMTSSEACLTAPNATSSPVQVQVAPNVTPDILIAVSPNGVVCDLDTLQFSSSLQAAGSTPLITWRVNGIPNGITGTSFSTNTLNAGDIVDAVLLSNAFCALPSTDTSNSITVAEDPLLTPSALISADPPGIFCDGTEITYSSTIQNGGSTPAYSWLLNGTQIFQGNDTLISSAFLNNDTLQLVMTSSERCLVFNPAFSNEIIIRRYPPLVPEIELPDEICEGVEVTLTVNVTGGDGGPYYYSWNNGLSADPTHFISPLITTTYIVVVSDSCSTLRSDTATIVVHPLPDVSFLAEPKTTNVLYPYFQFTDQSTNAFSWFWDFGDGAFGTGPEPQHSYLDPGTYSVLLIVTSEFGCADSARDTVNLEDVVIYYMPNSFTPNGDGINETFGPTGHSVNSYEMEIFNRWGQPVFKTSGLGTWDGTYNGMEAPQGLYIYRLKVADDPEKRTLTGTVTLVR